MTALQFMLISMVPMLKKFPFILWQSWAQSPGHRRRCFRFWGRTGAPWKCWACPTTIFGVATSCSNRIQGWSFLCPSNSHWTHSGSCTSSRSTGEAICGGRTCHRTGCWGEGGQGNTCLDNRLIWFLLVILASFGLGMFGNTDSKTPGLF